MSELADTTMKSSSPTPSFMETILQSSWQLLIKAPDTSLGSVEILITYRGDKNHSSKKKADTGLLINYLQGVLPKLQKKIKRVESEWQRRSGRWWGRAVFHSHSRG